MWRAASVAGDFTGGVLFDLTLRGGEALLEVAGAVEDEDLDDDVGSNMIRLW